MIYQPDPKILQLGSDFYDEVRPAPFPKKILRYQNNFWAQKVGLKFSSDAEWQKHFADFSPLDRNLPKCLALKYHGHQFRHYNPDIGDGRGFLFAQLRDDSGRLLDLGTKGSGQTPYSRSGDGRLTLKGAVREALATEMLEAHGVNTSKTFCFFETGEDLVRGDEPSPTRSAVLTRLSHGHIRIGTFQRLAFYDDKKNIATLTEYCLENYYHNQRDFLDPCVSLFSNVCIFTASTCAQWIMAGFVHGVLNTDNINISGESFDYGPYRFLPTYDLNFIAAYFDHSGLYRFGRQPEAIYWNLQQLAGCLNLITNDQKLYEKLLETFFEQFERALVACFLKRMGQKPQDFLTDRSQFAEWQSEMINNKKSFELGFSKSPGTLLIKEIEDIWKKISDQDDWSAFNQKISDLRKSVC